MRRQFINLRARTYDRVWGKVFRRPSSIQIKIHETRKKKDRQTWNNRNEYQIFHINNSSLSLSLLFFSCIFFQFRFVINFYCLVISVSANIEYQMSYTYAICINNGWTEREHIPTTIIATLPPVPILAISLILDTEKLLRALAYTLRAYTNPANVPHLFLVAQFLFSCCPIHTIVHTFVAIHTYFLAVKSEAIPFMLPITHATHRSNSATNRFLCISRMCLVPFYSSICSIHIHIHTEAPSDRISKLPSSASRTKVASATEKYEICVFIKNKKIYFNPFPISLYYFIHRVNGRLFSLSTE